MTTTGWLFAGAMLAGVFLIAFLSVTNSLKRKLQFEQSMRANYNILLGTANALLERVDRELTQNGSVSAVTKQDVHDYLFPPFTPAEEEE